MAQTASHLPDKEYGFHAATKDDDGEKRPISDVIYDTCEEADAAATTFLEEQAFKEANGGYWEQVDFPIALSVGIAMLSLTAWVYDVSWVKVLPVSLIALALFSWGVSNSIRFRRMWAANRAE